MPKRKQPQEDPKKQFERFVETAREHDLDEQEAKRKFKELTPQSNAAKRKRQD